MGSTFHLIITRTRIRTGRSGREASRMARKPEKMSNSELIKELHKAAELRRKTRFDELNREAMRRGLGRKRIRKRD